MILSGSLSRPIFDKKALNMRRVENSALVRIPNSPLKRHPENRVPFLIWKGIRTEADQSENLGSGQKTVH